MSSHRCWSVSLRVVAVGLALTACILLAKWHHTRPIFSEGRYVRDPTEAPSYSLPVSVAPIDATTTGSGGPPGVSAIVGGYDSPPASFFVMLLTWNATAREWAFMGCSGSLISNRHVLTAAHCVYKRDAKIDAVYINAYQPFEENAGYPFHFSRVQSYMTHVNFNKGNPSDNDVAVISLQVPVDTSKYAPIRLADSSLPMQDGDTVSVLGFGQESEKAKTMSDTLQMVEMPFVSLASCKAFYVNGLVQEDMVCGGLVSGGGRDACYGDSGGPMLVTKGGKKYQIGVVSWGSGCGHKPGVYASVRYHFEWIQKMACTDPAGVDRSGALCASFVAAGVVSSTSTTTKYLRANCVLKSQASKCSYGGQCCSGICSLVAGWSGNLFSDGSDTFRCK
jgi:secreted trypsin-like serine protease